MREVHFSPNVLSLIELKKTPLWTLEPKPFIIRALENAEHWLTFDSSELDERILAAGSPYKEWAAAALLSFGERIDRSLTIKDVEQLKTSLEPLKVQETDFVKSADNLFETLYAFIQAHEECAAWVEQGFKPYKQSRARGVHTLRAAGTADIVIQDADLDSKKVLSLTASLRLARIYSFTGTDSRGRSTEPPEFEFTHQSNTPQTSPIPIAYVLDGANKQRLVRFTIPGTYSLYLPDKVHAARLIQVH